MNSEELIKRRSLHRRFMEKMLCFRPTGDLMRIIAGTEMLTGEKIKSLWEEALSSNVKKLNFYTHIPFCLKKCSFCMYYSSELKDTDTVSNYVDNLCRRYGYFSDVFSGRFFSSMYFGGGTPNIISNKDIEKLFTSIYKNYNFADESERTFEGNPVFANYGKLKLLREFGINRVSFGVQSFDNIILDSNGRKVQNYQIIQKVVNDSLSLGFNSINLDLIIGFAEDTEEGFVNSFRNALSTGATSVSVYPMKPEGRYVRDFFSGDVVVARDHVRILTERVIPKIVDIAKKNGYTVPDFDRLLRIPGNGSCYNFNSEKNRVKNFDFQYFSETVDNPSSTFGIGVGSCSDIFSGKIAVKADSFLEHPTDDLYETICFSKEDQCLDYMVKQLSIFNKISNNEVKAKFGAKIEEIFGEDKLLELIDYGIIKIINDDIIMESDDVEKRMENLLFFIGEERIRKFVKNGCLTTSNIQESAFTGSDIFTEDEVVANNNPKPLFIETDFSKETDNEIANILEGVDCYILNGDFKSFLDDMIIINDESGEEKHIEITEQTRTVMQAIKLMDSTNEKTYWKYIEKSMFFIQERLSLVINRNNNQALLIKKVIPFD